MEIGVAIGAAAGRTPPRRFLEPRAERRGGRSSIPQREAVEDPEETEPAVPAGFVQALIDPGPPARLRSSSRCPRACRNAGRSPLDDTRRSPPTAMRRRRQLGRGRRAGRASCRSTSASSGDKDGTWRAAQPSGQRDRSGAGSRHPRAARSARPGIASGLRLRSGRCTRRSSKRSTTRAQPPRRSSTSSTRSSGSRHPGSCCTARARCRARPGRSAATARAARRDPRRVPLAP